MDAVLGGWGAVSYILLVKKKSELFWMNIKVFIPVKLD